ncbi:MAG TPA: phosphoenolpyruvate--protein phosphotransferase [Firmicutes bacterium]|jgi:phosphoenolpyruvate-protein phosphotransferase (PTS system enzyme I)|nr:phosphoenolpyruvate--protein phosphotransferase [Bacillota bacterium]
MEKGIPASKGYAIGTAFVVGVDELPVNEEKAASVEVEQGRLRMAIENTGKQLHALGEKTRQEMGEEPAAIIDVQIQMLDDPEFTGKAAARIEMDRISAAKAIHDVMNQYIEILSGLEDEYLRERVADVKDVGTRLLRNLAGKTGNLFAGLPDNAVVVARDFTPSDTAQMDKIKVIAFMTDIGGPTSHSAIMARTLEIPAVVGLKNISAIVKTGDIVIVDGIEGNVLVNPDETTLALYQSKRNQFETEKAKLKDLAHTQTITKAGKQIIVAANIGKPADVDKAIENGAEGIGLFRSEFLYMDRPNMPSENEQFEGYKQVAEKMAGKPVVIRTLDIGGDKKLSYLPLADEMNPFLGLRAIRLCLNQKDLFKTQLRALLRASIYGDIQIMFPMIGSLAEFLDAKEVTRECMVELKKEKQPFNEKIQIGMMIEIPSAAIIAETLAKEADFFSIGTNDLIQYTLAVDRMNPNVSYLYNPMHPAILKLIKMTIDAAHKEGKWCGMCGEMAGDAKAIPTLLEYGLDEFSMNAGSILEARKIIMNS